MVFTNPELRCALRRSLSGVEMVGMS